MTKREPTVIQELVTRLYKYDHIETMLMDDGEEKMLRIAHIGSTAYAIKILLEEKHKEFEQEYQRLVRLVKKQKAEQPKVEAG